MNFFQREGEVSFFTSLLSQAFANLFDRLFLVIVSLILLTFQSFAQSDDWTLSAEQGGVKISYQLAMCSDEPVALLKFQNTTNDSLRVDWYEYARLVGLTEEVKLSPVPFIVFLGGQESISGSCDTESLLQTKSRPSLMYRMYHIDQNDTTSFEDFNRYKIESFRLEIETIQKSN